MAEPEQIRFEDGAGYETFMGVWSRLVGEQFLDWLQPAAGKDWIDVGCGNGAFTELVCERAAPKSILGIDPSDGQLAFARGRHARGIATFEQASAMALPAADGSVDIAVSALVIFFMPDPALGVREMARVTRKGGSVATYAWDLVGGGFPYDPVQVELRAIGAPALMPPHPEAADLAELSRLWTAAGLSDIRTHVITVARAFPSFEDYWQLTARSGGLGPVIAKLPADRVAELKERIRARVGGKGDGPINPTARAHAVVGRVE